MNLSRLLQLSGVVAIALVIPLLAGVWLDRAYDTTPWLALAGTVVGTLFATAGVVRLIGSAYMGITKKHPRTRRTQSSA